MDTEAMIYVFGPLIAFSIAAALTFGVVSYNEFKRTRQ